MFRFVVSVVTLSIATIAPPAFAATIYDSSGAFLPLVAPGAFLNTFSTGGNDGGTPVVGPLLYSESGYSYSITSNPGNFFADNNVIGNWNPSAPVIITFTGSPVTAIGGNFFFTDVGGAFFDDAFLRIDLSDGTSESFFAPATSAYRGFIATSPITTVTFQPPTGQVTPTARFYNIDNLTVGSAIAVPEPTTLSLVATVGAVAWYARRRRMRRVVVAS